MTQCQKILEYMKQYGTITPLDAIREFGCLRLAARISDLEKQGYDIEHKTMSSMNRFGEKVHYMGYSLVA